MVPVFVFAVNVGAPLLTLVGVVDEGAIRLTTMSFGQIDTPLG